MQLPADSGSFDLDSDAPDHAADHIDSVGGYDYDFHFDDDEEEAEEEDEEDEDEAGYDEDGNEIDTSEEELYGFSEELRE